MIRQSHQVSVKISGKELLKPQKPEALPEVDGISGGFSGFWEANHHFL